MKDYTVTKEYLYKDKVPCYSFTGLTHRMLKENNLLNNKHIPLEYLRASVGQRQKLFEGLMFDGWTRASKGKQENEFYSSNETLFNQVVELARSLGYHVKVTSRIGKYNNKETKKAYRARFRKDRYKSIKEIKKVASVPTRCLTVDAEDHLFVVGKGWTVTHNTEIFRCIEHHLIKTTDERVGIIHLEEDDRRTICGLVGYELKKPVHLPDSELSDEDILNHYKKLVVTDDRVFMYSHFGSDDPNTILSIIRYLVSVCKCKFIFLDHITMLVTGFEDEDERKKLDYLSTKLAMLTRELNFTLFLISHVNDDGKTRGSRNISKVADLIVSIERDTKSENEDERNTTRLSVIGNRYGSTSGPAGHLRFDPKTFCLRELAENEKTFDTSF